MKPPKLTPELETEVKLMKLRHVLDPRYKYSKEDEEFPKYFEVY